MTAGGATATFSGNVGNTQALADFDVTAGSILFNAAAAQSVNVSAGAGRHGNVDGSVDAGPEPDGQH